MIFNSAAVRVLATRRAAVVASGGGNRIVGNNKNVATTPFRRSFAAASAVPVDYEDDHDDSSHHHHVGSSSSRLMYDVIPKSDLGRYQEYSVIHTNRSLNIMSDPFSRVMRDLDALMKETYKASDVAIIPGSGTFGMEAVARQFATDEHVMVLRNGWFSYRWTEIFEQGQIPKSHTVLKAQPQQQEDCSTPQYAPYPVDDVVAKIYDEQPAAFFCAHVETSTGMILPDAYIRKVGEAMRDVGGILVLDCIASGAIWADMKDLGVDVVISAPQKGWTGPCCCEMIMMSDHAKTTTDQQSPDNKQSSYALSLPKWTTVMDKYVNHAYMYHTTMPTDSLRDFHEISVETLKFGLPELKMKQYELGKVARSALEERGLISVAAEGYKAPGVLVYYSPNQTIENVDMMNAFKNAPQELQIAMGVPWAINEPQGLKTWRVGLFGIDKMSNIHGTVSTLTDALDSILRNVDTDIPKAA